jgi:flavodoxin
MLMNIVIVYDSQTGTTRKAAESMGKTFKEGGHQCQLLSISDAKPAEISDADLICIGSWVKGLFIIGQHPTAGTMNLINRFEDLTGKDAVVFCTYKLAIGSTLRKMAKELEGKGANVMGQFKFRGPEPDSKFAAFAASLS